MNWYLSCFWKRLASHKLVYVANCLNHMQTALMSPLTQFYLTAADSIGVHHSRWYSCASWPGRRRMLHPGVERSLQRSQLHRQLQICQHSQSALLSPALPCPALPCPALPCPALPYPAVPRPALSCAALPCNCCNKHAATHNSQFKCKEWLEAMHPYSDLHLMEKPHCCLPAGCAWVHSPTWFRHALKITDA